MKPFLTILFLLCLGCTPVLPIQNPFSEPRATTENTEASPRNLIIEILDVGQGDATLVRGPFGKTLLIDAGPEGAGLGAVLPRLEALGIEELDAIVATHYDADHIGGIPEVIRGLDQTFGTDDDYAPTEALFDRGDDTEKATSIYTGYTALLPEKRREAVAGFIIDLGGDAEAEVVVVNGRYNNGKKIHLNPDEENEASIGLLIRYGTFRYFTAGDLSGGGAPGGYETKDLETEAGAILGDIDVLHAGHHGSASSSNEGFLRQTRPEAVVISVGADNDYGHPAPAVLSRLEGIGADVFRTDQKGPLEIVSDGYHYEIHSLTPPEIHQ